MFNRKARARIDALRNRNREALDRQYNTVDPHAFDTAPDRTRVTSDNDR